MIYFKKNIFNSKKTTAKLNWISLPPLIIGKLAISFNYLRNGETTVAIIYYRSGLWRFQRDVVIIPESEISEDDIRYLLISCFNKLGYHQKGEHILSSNSVEYKCMTRVSEEDVKKLINKNMVS